MFSWAMASRFTAADDEQLIELAAGHPLLWDMSHEEFKNIMKKELIWKEIAGMLNKTGKLVFFYSLRF